MKSEDAKVGAKVRLVSLENSKQYVSIGGKGLKIGKTYVIQNVFPSTDKVIINYKIVSMDDVVLLDEIVNQDKKQIVETFNPKELVMNNDSSDV